MIVIVASQYDLSARRLRERWADKDVSLLTPEDLSICGWRFYPSEPERCTVVVGGREVKQSEIRGVFTRLAWVGEAELENIVSEDRAYAAAEMSALLLCWLSGLSCPVINRPTVGCLNGPGWRQEEWLAMASKAGIPVQPIRRRASLKSSSIDKVESSAGLSLTVVGERCFGMADETLVTWARHLAELAKVDLLGVQFSGPDAGACLVGATSSPDVDVDGVGDAVLSHLGGVRTT